MNWLELRATDTALLTRWIERRDAEAFEELAMRYGRMVYATALRLSGNATEAEDIAQESFEKLALQERALKAPIAPWLYRVTVNRALNEAKLQRRRLAREHQYASGQMTDQEPTWDDVYAHIDIAVMDLPDDIRHVIVAHFMQRQSHKMIARELNVSRTTVTYRIKKGVELIRHALKEKGVTVSVTALAALMVGNLAEGAAIPESLASILGKIALAGMREKGVGTVESSVAKTAGALTMKNAIFAVVAALLLAFGATGVFWLAKYHQEMRQAVETSAPVRHAEVTPQVKTDDATPSSPQEKETVRPAYPAASSGVTEGFPFTLSGKVFTEQGELVSGAAITMTPTGFPETPPPYVSFWEKFRKSFTSNPEHYAATSKSDGSFMISGSTTGGHAAIRATSNGYAGGVQVEIERDRPLKDINIAMEKAVLLKGRLVGSNNEPIAAAAVHALELYPSEGPWTYGPMSRAWNVTCTDEQGLFQLGLPREGKVSLAVTARGYPEYGFEVPLKDSQPVLLKLEKPASLTGRILRPDGTPPVGVGVDINTGYNILVATTCVGPDGTYSFESVPPGQINKMVVATSMFPKAVLLPKLLPGEHKVFDMTCDATTTVKGKVCLEGTAQGIPGASVEICRENNTITQVFTNDDGGFSVEFPSGACRVVAAHLFASESATPEGAAVDVDGLPNAVYGATLYLKEALRVPIQVLDGNGMPVADATIAVTQEHTRGANSQIFDNAGTTDSLGLFTWAHCTIGDTYSISVRKAGFADASSAQFAAHTESPLDVMTFTLSASSGLEGTATCEDGTTLANATIYAYLTTPNYPNAPRIFRTDTQGRFTIYENIPATCVSIRFETKPNEQNPGLSAIAKSVECVSGSIVNLGQLVFSQLPSER